MAFPYQEFEFAPQAAHKVLFRHTHVDTDGSMLQMEVHLGPTTPGMPMHYHPVQEERIEVLQGRLTCIIEGEHYILHPGDKIIINPGDAHTYSNDTNSPVHFLNEMHPALDFEYFIEELQNCTTSHKVKRINSLRGSIFFMLIFNQYKKEMMLAGRVNKLLGSILIAIGKTLQFNRNGSKLN